MLPGVIHAQPNIVGVAPSGMELLLDTSSTNLVSLELAGNDEEKADKLEDILIMAGATHDEMAYLVHIAYWESKFDLAAEPYTHVAYCSDGNWGEIYAGGQFRCEDFGSTTIRTEKSYGLFQILPSTAQDHGCANDWKLNAYTQSQCAIKVARGQGLTAWSTLYLL